MEGMSLIILFPYQDFHIKDTFVFCSWPLFEASTLEDQQVSCLDKSSNDVMGPTPNNRDT